MVSTEAIVAVLVSDAALYGFMVLYYTTSMALREQERFGISLERTLAVAKDLPGEGHGTAVAEADERWVNSLAGSAANNMFLLGCTLFAVPSIFLGVLSLVGFDVLGLGSIALFLTFVFVVAVGMAGVGIQTFRLHIRDARRKLGADTPLMDILNRGLGKR